MQIRRSKEEEPKEERVYDDFQSMIKWYDQELKNNPKDIGMWYAKGVTLAKYGKFQEASESFGKIIELEPEHKKAWEGRASALFELRKFDEALRCFMKVSSLDPENEHCWYHMGECLSKLRRYGEAIACYDKALKLDRNFVEAWYGKGNALKKLAAGEEIKTPDKKAESTEIIDSRKRWEDALKCFTEVLELDASNPDAWIGKGDAFCELNNYDEGIKCYERATKLKSISTIAWCSLGKALKRKGSGDEAIKSFDTASQIELRKISAQNLDYWRAKAEASVELQKYNIALDALNKILAFDSNDYPSLVLKGQILEKIGNLREAISCYEMASSLNPEDEQIWRSLARVYKTVNMPEKAIQFYDRVISSNPNSEEPLCEKAELLYAVGRIEEALSSFVDVLNLNPNNIKAKNFSDEIIDSGNLPKKRIEVITARLSEKSRQLQAAPAIEVKPIKVTITKEEPKPEREIVEDLQVLEGKDFNYWYEKGLAYSKSAQYLEALKCFDKALEFNPKSEDIWHAKGDVHTALEQSEEAAECYRRAAKVALGAVDKQALEGEPTLSKLAAEWRSELESVASAKGYRDEKELFILEKLVEGIGEIDYRGKTLFTVSYTQISKINLFLLKILLDIKKWKGVFVAMDRPHRYMRSLLGTRNIAQSNLIFVDAVSNISEIALSEGENVRFTSGPLQVEILPDIFATGYERDTRQNLIDLKEIDFIVIDNIANMLPYNPLSRVENFTKRFLSTAKEQRYLFTSIIIDKKVHSQLYNTVKQYCDKEIEIKEEWFRS